MPKIFQKPSDQQMDRKGKSKSTDTSASQSEDSNLLQPYHTPVTRLRQSESRPSSSIGSSPLSVQVTSNDADHVADGVDANMRPRSSLTPDRGVSLEIPEQKIEIRKRPVASAGFDSDPAQIVNMALSLSEARRRQASERRYISATQPIPGRNVSAAHTGSARSRQQRVGSVAQYLQTQRTPSLRSSIGGPVRIPNTPPTNDATLVDDVDDAMDVDDWEQDVSAPTQARVEKAKAFFELSYEHRRLLSHLPPVRRPGTSVNPANPDSRSKAYNPLQYIRNRKLRLWSKTAIDAEAEGWHDVEKHDEDECVRLPPLVEREKERNGNSRAASQSVSTERYAIRSHQDSTIKSRRPRSDFVFHPGDLIADCFWLEQGINKSRILDRDNNNIYPPNTQFKFSGWRNRTPVHLPEGLQQPSPPGSDAEDEVKDSSLHPVSELPRSKVKDSIAAADEGGFAKGLKVLMDDSASSGSDDSSGSGSSGDERERGRKRLRKRQKQNIDVSPGQVPTLPPVRNLHDTTASDQSAPSSRQASKRASLDHGPSRVGRFLKRESASKNRKSTSTTREEHRPQDAVDKFPVLEEQPRASAEYDTTAPNSPTHTHWPSIAINLESPPPSRSTSPAKRQSHVAAILKPLHRHHKQESISAVDFGASSKKSSVSAPGEKAKDDSTDASRGTSPMTRGQSPMTKRDSDLPVANAVYESHPMSRYSTKSSAPSDHHKLRGIFKGGRIAEIVGHEVSKVGDYIWKKDPPPAYRGRKPSEEGSGYETDEETEPMNGAVLKTPPAHIVRSRSSTVSSTKSDSPKVNNKSPPSSGRPKYNNPNLPSFTSPFDKDREAQEKKTALLTPTATRDDHISRQAAEHRSNSRSPRMDRLAPPKLDTGDRSSSGSRLTPQRSRESAGLGLVLTRSQEATNKLNTALGDKVGLDLTRMATHDLDESPYVTFRDINRAVAFIYTSTVKAREISRHADLPRKRPQYMTDAMTGFGRDSHARADLAMVARREEKVVAARQIMERLTEDHETFTTKLQEFSGTTAPALARLLQEQEDLVENKMTPRVRQSADEAGELSIRLASTSTLAVKGVNEAIDAAMMKRVGGPMRWVRSTWYRAVEMTVVSLLWAIWAVVSIIRVFLAIISGSVRGVRWLLFL
ncbi:uncharacterized protein AB675_3515 [Cyphellophora attinorum]|uniref:Maintenance of telomere capping protein 4 n=1 Tax=Cyphellophora attinorum TaxID=1664694 RepID=A0A0N1HTC5_9EURO|nr:uncharacterized protein AB675_3515 [Phialophora attinorum]KPI39732.1 hypothetical protein AB675_3515 [Phialophora attinorum]